MLTLLQNGGNRVSGELKIYNVLGEDALLETIVCKEV